MTYMKQILQEESVFFSGLDESMLLAEGFNFAKVKELLTQLKRDPHANKLKKLVIDAEGILKTNGELSESSRNKLWLIILSIVRVMTDINYVAAGLGTVGVAAVGGAVGGIVPIVFALFNGLVAIAINRLIKYGLNEVEKATERKSALKTLSELKKLEKKVPEKNKSKVRSQIDKLESALKDN